MIGFSASPGNVSIASTRPLTSSGTSRTSAPLISSIVTVPEPLAVRETVQLYDGLRGRKDLHLGHLFINRMPRQWLDEAEERLVERELEGASVGQPWAEDLALAEYLTQRRRTAEKCLRGLRRDIPLPTVILDEHEEDSARIIEALCGTLLSLEVW